MTDNLNVKKRETRKREQTGQVSDMETEKKKARIKHLQREPGTYSKAENRASKSGGGAETGEEDQGYAGADSNRKITDKMTQWK